jgi:Domain of unknown function (DUF4397)
MGVGRAMVGWAAVALLAGCGDSGGTGGTPDGGSSSEAQVRFAHLSPDATAFDVCARTSGTTAWGQPRLAAAGLNGGLSFPSLSLALPLAPGGWDFRLVAAGAADCNTALLGLPDSLNVTLDSRGDYTFAAVGYVAPPQGSLNGFRFQEYIDDAVPPSTGKAKVRLVNASPNVGTVVFGLKNGSSFQPLSGSVTFRFTASGQGIVNGYQELAAMSGAILAIRPEGSPFDAADSQPMDLPVSAIQGVWAIGLAGGTGTQSLGFLVCQESGSSSGGLASCARR